MSLTQVAKFTKYINHHYAVRASGSSPSRHHAAQGQFADFAFSYQEDPDKRGRPAPDDTHLEGLVGEAEE